MIIERDLGIEIKVPSIYSMKYDGINSYLLKMVILTYIPIYPRSSYTLYIFNQKLINTFLLRRPFHDFDESSKLVKKLHDQYALYIKRKLLRQQMIRLLIIGFKDADS